MTNNDQNVWEEGPGSQESEENDYITPKYKVAITERNATFSTDFSFCPVGTDLSQ